MYLFGTILQPLTSDTSGECSEMAYPTENDTIYLLNWLEKMREKLRSKLEKEIQKSEMSTSLLSKSAARV